MANRYGFDTQSLDRQTKKLYGKVVANVLQTLNNSGMASVVVSATDITITLDDKWSMLLSLNVIADTAALYELASEDVAGTKVIVINTVDADGLALDLSAATIWLELTFKNSSVR